MNKRTLSRLLFFAAVLVACIGLAGGAILPSETIDLQVKEPLEILPQNADFSVFPGEKLDFDVTVENHASVSYNTRLCFGLNDTEYQNKYVTFSNITYTIQSGQNILNAWLSVKNTAPATDLKLTVTIIRDLELKPENDIPDNDIIENDTAPSLMLFAAGAKWAAQNGTSALYVNWYDNYCAHYFSDGADWGPYFPNLGATEIEQVEQVKNLTVNLLEQQGLTVTCTGDIPNDLSGYDLIIFEAYYAVEPQHSQPVREYLANGGNVVVTAGIPSYFITYCKNPWPGEGGIDLSSIQDWFGSASYTNSGGTADLAVDKPFSTTLEDQSQVFHMETYSFAALTSVDDDAQIIAYWSAGGVYAFTHEYGNGRVYYQSAMDW